MNPIAGFCCTHWTRYGNEGGGLGGDGEGAQQYGEAWNKGEVASGDVSSGNGMH